MSRDVGDVDRVERAEKRDELLVGISQAFAKPVGATGLLAAEGELPQRARVCDDVNRSRGDGLGVKKSFS